MKSRKKDILEAIKFIFLDTNRSGSYQYNNQAFEHDLSNINIQPAQEIISTESPRRMPPTSDIQTGRSTLHRLLDEVLDKAESEESYNPDSERERQKRRRQRRRVHSVSNDDKIQPVSSRSEPVPDVRHTPVIPQVSERPDKSTIDLHYNPYEAGDRASEIARFKPVELKPKYPIDDYQTHQYSARSNPPLFFDESTLADRSATATDAYSNRKRIAKTRIETDREAMMRYENGQIDPRKHKFNDQDIYIDSTSKDHNGYHAQPRNAWIESETKNSDYRDEYKSAKKSVLNTKSIISSINDGLQQMSYPRSSDDYHA